MPYGKKGRYFVFSMWNTKSGSDEKFRQCGRAASAGPRHLRWYHLSVYARKLIVEIVVAGQRRPCPLEWLDQFCMRNFTNAAEFDDTLPTAEGRLELSFRVTPERFAEVFSAWLMQRGKGNGQPVQVDVRPAES